LFFPKKVRNLLEFSFPIPAVAENIFPAAGGGWAYSPHGFEGVIWTAQCYGSYLGINSNPLLHRRGTSQVCIELVLLSGTDFSIHVVHMGRRKQPPAPLG
jgi:hypothetical protein